MDSVGVDGIRVGDVEVVPGHNPRTYFDTRSMEELKQSIRSQGVVQGISVRPHPDKPGKFQLIAGERRLRAARDVHGDDWRIPATVRPMSDTQMAAVAFIENTQREDMSFANQAEGAHKVLIACKGDKDEAALQLGWSVGTLTRRLALLQATQEVRQALTEKKIDLGHAELMAALAQDKQGIVLRNVLQHNVPVQELKRQIARMANDLAAAIFDKTECTQCPHNSALQHALFSDAIEAGSCTNRDCWGQKVTQELDRIAVSLREEVGRVEILRAGSPVETIRLVPDGATGVGGDQAKACRGCAKFGATVSGLAGSEGEVARSICFDRSCHTDMVTKRIRELKKLEAAKEASPAADGSSGAASTQGNSGKPASGSAKAAPAPAVPATTTTVGAVSSRVKEYRVKVWRNAATRTAFASDGASRDLLIGLALRGLCGNFETQSIRDGFAKLTGQHVGSLVKLATIQSAVKECKDEAKATLVRSLAATAMRNVSEVDLVDCLTFLDVRLENHWTIDKEFLELLTKAEIYAVAVEIGVIKAIGQATFKKLSEGKKDVLINGVLKADGFCFAGVVPSCMRWKAPADAGGVGSADDELPDDEGGVGGGDGDEDGVTRTVQEEPEAAVVG